VGLSGFYQFFMRSLFKLRGEHEEGMRGFLPGRWREPENLWKSRRKIDFVENLHCFFMSRLFNFLQATLVVYPFECTQPDRTQT